MPLKNGATGRKTSPTKGRAQDPGARQDIFAVSGQENVFSWTRGAKISSKQPLGFHENCLLNHYLRAKKEGLQL
jgi:hypothetical protein